MSERIVDEAFAAELADNRGSSADERLNRIQELLGESEAKEAISILLDVIRTQNARIAALEEQLYRVYVKSGESLAQLKIDLGSSPNSSGGFSDMLTNIRTELKLLRGDVYARSDQQIQHIEDRMSALEHDAARASGAYKKQLDDLLEIIEQLRADSRSER